MKKLKKSILKLEFRDRIYNDHNIIGILCTITGKNPNTCLQFVYRNCSKELLSIDVVDAICNYYGLKRGDIFL